MDLASIISDLACPDLSLSEVAARHGLTIEELSTYLNSDQAQATLDLVQSTLAIRTRLAAQIRLPIAIAALGTLLISHRAVACPSPSAQHGGSLSTNARQDSPPGAHARRDGDGSHLPSIANQPNPPMSVPRTLPPRDEARTLRDQARALRQQIELRHAAATLLRFANFNHRTLGRAETRHASTVPKMPRASSPPEVPPSHAQCVETHASPTAATPTSPNSTTPAPAAADIDASPTASACSAATTAFPDPASASVTAPVPASTRIATSPPSATSTFSSTSASHPSPSSTPVRIPAPPYSSHLDPSYPSSSSSPLFLRASVPRWLVPSPISHRRTSAATRLAAAAGTPSRPP
jgi:hypothetical protein